MCNTPPWRHFVEWRYVYLPQHIIIHVLLLHSVTEFRKTRSVYMWSVYVHVVHNKQLSYGREEWQRGGSLWGEILGWRIMFCANIYGPLDRGIIIVVCSYTTTLPLEVFTQRNFVADFIRLKLTFIFFKLLFEPPFALGRLQDNVCHSIYSSLESPWSTSYSL